MDVLAILGWFIPVIFDKYFTSQLEAWSSRAGLGDSVKSLKSQLRKINLLLGAAQGRKIQNKHLLQSLRDLNQLVYDADNLLDELDYYRIQDEVEGPTYNYAYDVDSSTSASSSSSTSAIQVMSNVASNTSNLVFPNFLLKRAFDTPSPDVGIRPSAPAPERTLDAYGNCSSKRSKFDRHDMSRRIKEVVGQLHEISEDVHGALLLEKLDSIKRGIGRESTNVCRTTSYFTEPKVFGRDRERDHIVELLLSDKYNDAFVLSIVGHGGVGKTTLARYVYNDPRVADYFQERMWICVSNNFDVFRLTYEMLDHVSGDRHHHKGIKNLNRLQKILKDSLKSKTFLLVVDDMWEDMDECRWNVLLAPLRHNPVNGSRILVTTRNPYVARVIGTEDYFINLDGLKDNEFWSFFKACAFGDENHEGHQTLQNIGKEIIKKLKGCPLAAKSVGALLRRNLDDVYWNRILESSEWKSLKSFDGIIPALMLSYQQLPFRLQQCFSYCSLFPKSSKFDGKELGIWIAQGFVDPDSDGKRLEDIGTEYLNELCDWGFFQKYGIYYKMHDLMHDLAQTVSSNECLTIDGCEPRVVQSTTRHVSIITFSAYIQDATGRETPANECFEKELVNVCKSLRVEKLSTLMLFGIYDEGFAKTFRSVFREVKFLRVLRLSIMPNDVDPFLCGFNFLHLRYLAVQCPDPPYYKLDFRQFPESVSKLYHLQTLDIRFWKYLSDVPKGISKLINLRHFLSSERLQSEVSGIGNLTSLQELKEFRVRKERGFEIRQLGSLSELSESLSICGLENVESKQEASESRLLDKNRLYSLSLSWTNYYSDSRHTVDVEVMEGLQPHHKLRCLNIIGYKGTTVPTWLVDTSLINLKFLTLEHCTELDILPPLGQFPFLETLRLGNMSMIREVVFQVCGSGVAGGFRSLKHMIFCKLVEWEKWVGVYLFPSLHKLEILDCPKLRELPLCQCSSEDMNMQCLPALRELKIENCPVLVSLPPFPHTNELKILGRGLESELPWVLKEFSHRKMSKSCVSSVGKRKTYFFGKIGHKGLPSPAFTIHDSSRTEWEWDKVSLALVT